MDSSWGGSFGAAINTAISLIVILAVLLIASCGVNIFLLVR